MAMIISALLMGLLGVYAFMYRRERGVKYFVWVMLCRVVYAGAVILEMNSSQPQVQMFFRNVENTSLIMTVPLMALCVLDFLGRDRFLRNGWRLPLLASFAGWVVLVWTDPYTGWINKSVVTDGGHLTVTKTELAISLNLMAYLILAVCAFLFIIYLRQARPDVRGPGVWLIVFGCLSFAAEIVKAAHTDLSRWLLPVSVYSGCAAAVMLLIIMRNRLFSIVPLARNIVVESMEEGILIVNEQGKVVDVNSNVNGLFRDPSGQGLLGRDARELLADWPQWRDACLGLNSGRLEIVSHEGEEVRTFIVKVYPLSDRKRLGTVSILIDITDKQRSIEQIARLNGVKDQLLTMVSHDIRDPLAVQINLIEELEIRQDQLDEDNREMVAALGEQIRHSYVMVENLLEWFRGHKEGIELRPECLELRGLVDEACQLMQLKGQNKGIRLDIGIPERLFVYADRETTLLVARNLISNAIKFSYRGGLVEITAQPQDGCVLVAVRDYGVGMEEELAQGLFDERRFASQAGTEGEKGTGLGLLVCHQFVRLSGGRMWADSSPGRGSTFYFTLSGC